MTTIYVTNEAEEKEVRALLAKVPGWEGRYSLRYGPVVKMANVLNGRELDWFAGMPAVVSLLTVGYVAIGKYCPYLRSDCLKTECALYLVQRGVGDCAHLWAGLKE